ncbi:MAG: endonuclease/exonuclease/phosphatase (EEP) superfamily protein YafD [Kiritimatiellia bacterium]|jgi:endonuclease/exonuclease/phosphatase (EEP) superfamily protein YafD
MTSPPDEPTEPANEVPPTIDTPNDDAPNAVPSRRRTGGRIGLIMVVMSAAMVLCLLVITASGRSVRSPPLILTVLTVGLPYLYGLALLTLFAVWSALPDRKALPILGTIVLVCAAALWGGALPAWPEPADGDPLRMMSWNVRRLWGGPADGGDPTQCVIDTIREIEPDVLSLQEVSRDDVHRLSAELGMTCVHTDYLATGDPNRGGLAACARGSKWTMHSGLPARFIDASPWRYVFVEIAHDDVVINLMAVHLHPYNIAHGGLGDPWDVATSQGDQSAELLRRVSRFKDPTLVAGDFNSTRDQALHIALRGPMTDTYERGGQGFGPTVQLVGWIPLRIDYIYATDAFAVQASHVPAVDCSDHRPVISDIVLKPAD